MSTSQSHSTLPCHTTYVKAQSQRPFNWNRALLTVKRTSDRKLRRMYQLANSWVTCACGNQCNLIDRDWKGEPQDRLLAREGMAFVNRVGEMKGASTVRAFNEYRRKAIVTLARIEGRSAVLISRIVAAQANREVVS